MELLTRTEEFILLAVYRLDGDAYGVTIQKEMAQMIGKSFSVGAIYAPLERLADRGLLRRRVGLPTALRGGRRKRFYYLTPAGLAALETIRQLHDALWAGVPKLV